MPEPRSDLTTAARGRVRTTLVAALAAVTLVACGGDGEEEVVADVPEVTVEEESPDTTTATPETTEPGTTGPETTTPAPATGEPGDAAAGDAQAQITENWQRFFAGDTPAEERVALLQDGEQFATVIEQQGQSPVAQQTAAEVTGVTVTGDTAQVTYDILVGGSPALTGQTGEAVLVDGVWKVGRESFCALLALSGGAGEACAQAASPS